MQRRSIPEETKRAVLVEAGHRCAIPTCRSTTTEIAHIVPYAETQDNSFENLIALCPNCHTRYDQKKEIDRKSMEIYKRNLSILNNRYSDMERRLFEYLAQTKEKVFVLGAGGDMLVANAVKDGLFMLKSGPLDGLSFLADSPEGMTKQFPLQFTYWVTDTGADFIERYANGMDIV